MIFQLASDHDDLQALVCQSTRENLKTSIDTTTDLLRTLLSFAGSVYIVIDGVDEIDELERCRLLKQLFNVSETCIEVKILISSRSNADIMAFLKGKETIRVDDRNSGSIQTFVNQRAQEWFLERDFYPDSRLEITRSLAPLASTAKGRRFYQVCEPC